MPKSSYLRAKVITDNLSNGTKYIALFTDAAGIADTSQPVTEATTGNCPGYARQAATFNASGVSTNAQTFTASGAWATVRYVGIFDALTAGNMIYWDEITAETLANTNQLNLAAGQVTVTEK
jgi:hypothetical protein